MFKNSGRIAKFVVAVAGAVSSSLETYYGTEHWVPVVIAGITALTVYLVPNSQTTSTTAATPQPNDVQQP